MPLPKFLKTFYYASRGIIITVQRERNMKIHVVAALAVLILSFYFRISTTDFMIVTLLFGMVMSAELLNTAVEKTCDILRDKYRLPYDGSRDVRDIAAGGVLMQAIVAVLIGILIFGKYFN